MFAKLRDFADNESGATAIEYGLIAALVSVAGITAFFAWNWADLGYMVKFALIQSGVAGTALLAWRLGIDSIGGSASLFSSAFLVGVLFAVFGQVYQTGADPYGLFIAKPPCCAITARTESPIARYLSKTCA